MPVSMLTKYIQVITFGFALLWASALAGVTYKEEPCAEVDTELTDARQHEYAELIVGSINNGLQPSDIDIYNYMESGHWTAVYGNIPIADIAMFFFEKADGAAQFKQVWAGWALPSEKYELIAWAQELGAPDDLASCFAQRVIGDQSGDQR